VCVCVCVCVCVFKSLKWGALGASGGMGAGLRAGPPVTCTTCYRCTHLPTHTHLHPHPHNAPASAGASAPPAALLAPGHGSRQTGCCCCPNCRHLRRCCLAPAWLGACARPAARATGRTQPASPLPRPSVCWAGPAGCAARGRPAPGTAMHLQRCACVRACVRACVCVCVCLRACVHACMHACVCACCRLCLCTCKMPASHHCMRTSSSLSPVASEDASGRGGWLSSRLATSCKSSSCSCPWLALLPGLRENTARGSASMGIALAS